MRRTDDRDKGNAQQRLRLKLVRHKRQRADDADAAVAIEDRLDHSAKSFHVEPQRRMRIALAAVHRRLRQRLHREHHVHHDRKLGLEAFAHRASPRLESVHVVGDRAGIGQEAASLLGKAGIPCRAVEELHAQLRFQVGERLADHRLRAPQLAARGREASLVHRGDESPQLVQRHDVEHVHRP